MPSTTPNPPADAAGHSARRVRLVDIAARADVHLSTVSLALRNSPRLPEETRHRIQAIARELNYSEDPHLRALVAYRDQSRRRHAPLTVAYITHWSMPIAEVPHHRWFFEGAKARAAELGFKLDHLPLGLERPGGARIERILRARGIEGVILSSFYKGAPRLDLDWNRFCAVRIELQPEWPPVPSIAVNHTQTIREAVSRAIALGYRRPGFLIGEDWSPLVDDHWEMGFLWAQRQLSPEDRIAPFLFVKTSEGTLRRHRFERWVRTHRPDVLIGPHEVVLERLQSLGWRVPDDIAVIDPFLETPHSHFAGVVHRLREVGGAAVDRLAGMLLHHHHGIPAAPSHCYIDSVWSPGPSCPPARLAPRGQLGTHVRPGAHYAAAR